MTVHLNWGRILGRNWDKSLKEFSPLLFKVISTNEFYSPPPWTKVVWNCFVMSTSYMETSSLRSLKIMPRNLNDIVRSWMRFLVNLLPTYLTDYTAMNFEESNSKKCLYPIKGTSHHADKGLLKMVRLDRSWGVKGPNIVIWILNLLLYFFNFLYLK